MNNLHSQKESVCMSMTGMLVSRFHIVRVICNKQAITYTICVISYKAEIIRNR